MKAWRTRLLLVLVTLGLVLPVSAVEAAFTSLPAGFSDEQVISGVSSPTAIAWLPDRTLLATSQGGQVFRQNGSTGASILNLGAVCTGGEMGLLGLAVDPQFAAGQRFVYLYYTHHKNSKPCSKSSNRANRVSRFTMADDLTLSSEQVLIDNIAARGGNHNGGDLQFGRDGMLYVSVGDSGRDLISGDGQNGNRNARRLDLLNGKILRVTADGSIPADNPFAGTNSIACAASGRAVSTRGDVAAEKKNEKASKRKKQKQRERRRERRQQQNPLGSGEICGEIFASGLRNPYRIAFDPDDTSGPQRFFINDVGGGSWEEIDEGIGGADYGWNLREGPCKVGSTSNCTSDSRFTGPIHSYPHSSGCRTITGGAFVPDDSGWPDAWTSRYVYADFICGRIFMIDENNLAERLGFATGAKATHLAFGPDGALYYTDFLGNAVHRVVYTGP